MVIAYSKYKHSCGLIGRMMNALPIVGKTCMPACSTGLVFANGQLLAIEGQTLQHETSYSPVAWERETDPTRRIMASSIAGQFSYQVTGPGDLETSSAMAQEDPSISKAAQARARWALYRSAKLREESYLRNENLPEVLESPYEESVFAPTVDEGVQADSQRHGIHPDLRNDGEKGYWQGGGDRLAELRAMWKAHKINRSKLPWLLSAIKAEGWMAAQQRVEKYAARDSEGTRHMSRGRVNRWARVEQLSRLLANVDKSCQRATSDIRTYGKSYAQFAIAYARHGLAWVSILWGQYVTGRAMADKKRLASLCPVLQANQRWLTWTQRNWLDSKRSELLSKWSHIVGLTRAEALEYHNNVIMNPPAREYKGHYYVDYSSIKRHGVNDKNLAPSKKPVQKLEYFRGMAMGEKKEDIYNYLPNRVKRFYIQKLKCEKHGTYQGSTVCCPVCEMEKMQEGILELTSGKYKILAGSENEMETVFGIEITSATEAI